MMQLLVFSTLVLVGLTHSSYAMTDSCQCVAFRLDDVQDYWLDNVQIKIIDTFLNENASLTIGVIGNHFGYDTKILNYLKPLIHSNNRIEIANHGWNHEDFTKFNRNGQSMLMKEANQRISEFLGVVPTVFIPPFNAINNDTMIAFHENDFQYLSANVTSDPPPYLIPNHIPQHLPETAKNGDLNNNDTYWQSKTSKQIFVDIISSLQKYGYAEVVIHPQDYSVRESLNYSNNVDQTQIKQLESLIKEIRDEGLTIKTISKIPEHLTTPRIPFWVSHLFDMHEKRNLTDDEIYNAIKFLLKNKIIEFGS